jgi:hypothetical protein
MGSKMLAQSAVMHISSQHSGNLAIRFPQHHQCEDQLPHAYNKFSEARIN